MGQQQMFQPLTAAQAQAFVTALATSHAQGVRTVTFEGRSVTYNSPEEMLAAMNYWTRYANSLGDNAPPRNVRGSVFVRR